MKRILPVILAAILFAGCSTPPVSSAPPKSIATAAVSASPETVQTPALTEDSSDISLQDTQTPQPTPIPEADGSGFPPFSGENAPSGFVSGKMAVANNQYIYYYNEVGKVIDDQVYSHDEIYRLDRKAGKASKIRDTETYTMICKIYLDASGTLYYLCDDSQSGTQNTLFEYSPEKDKPLISDVSELLGEYNGTLYYQDTKENVCQYDPSNSTTRIILQNASDVQILKCKPILLCTVGSQLYSYDLSTGNQCMLAQIDGDYIISDDGNCIVAYSPVDNGTAIDLYDYATMRKHSFALPFKIPTVAAALVQDQQLVIMESTESDDYDIGDIVLHLINLQTGTLISDQRVNGVQSRSCSDGKWYLYTFKAVTHEDCNSDLTRQEVKYLNPETGKLSKVVSGLPNRGFDDDQDYTFEVAGGYVFMIDYYGTASSNDIWKRCKLPC